MQVFLCFLQKGKTRFKACEDPQCGTSALPEPHPPNLHCTLTPPALLTLKGGLWASALSAPPTWMGGQLLPCSHLVPMHCPNSVILPHH